MNGEDLNRIKEILSLTLSGLEDADFQNKCILITGGAGFLGSWLCDSLVNLKANVLCLDNLFSGVIENISHLNRHENFKFINHDITKPYYSKQKIDYIFHLASRASPFEFSRYPIQILKANTLGTWIVLGMAVKNDAKILYTSTSEVYGDPDPEKIPLKETYNGNVNPIGYRSCYDEAKRAGEAFVKAYILEHGLDARIVRIFNTYGPRIKAGNIYGRVIPNFIDQAIHNNPLEIFGDGLQTRSFTFLSDMIYGLILALKSDNAKDQVINLGSTNEITILDLAKLIIKITNSQSKINYLPSKPDDPKRRCPNIDKARKILNWYPKIELEKGLNYTINWFKNKKS